MAREKISSAAFQLSSEARPGNLRSWISVPSLEAWTCVDTCVALSIQHFTLCITLPVHSYGYHWFLHLNNASAFKVVTIFFKQENKVDLKF